MDNKYRKRPLLGRLCVNVNKYIVNMKLKVRLVSLFVSANN